MANEPFPIDVLERTPRTEQARPYRELIGLQTRLLMPEPALDPTTVLPQITHEAFLPFEQQTATLTRISNASTRERKEHWEKSGTKDFLQQKQTWIENTAKTFQDAKEFFGSAEGMGAEWREALLRQNIQADNFTPQQAEQLYSQYFSGSQAQSDIRGFVVNVIDTYKTTDEKAPLDHEQLVKDLPAIQWLAGIFGSNSSEIVTQLIDAEVKLYTNPQNLIEKANEKQQDTNNQEVLRINNLEAREKELLEFLLKKGHALHVTLPPPAPSDTTHPPEDTTTTTAIPENLQNTIEGKGFEEIINKGWNEYREGLLKTSFSQIIEANLQDIHRLEEEARNNPQVLPPDELIRLNRVAAERANQLKIDVPAKSPHGPDADFQAFYDKDVDKIHIRGKNHDANPFPLRRIYFTTNLRTAPEAYLSLFETLNEEDVIQDIDLALNMDNFQESVMTSGSLNDSIILYIKGEQPENMQKIAKAVKKAKTKNPAVWQMTPAELADAKRTMLENFKIPLDDTTGFVEMADRFSFDTQDQIKIRDELHVWGPRYYPNEPNRPPYAGSIQLEELQTRMRHYTPDKPEVFTYKGGSMPHRRKFMPALLYDLAIPNQEVETTPTGTEPAAATAAEPTLLPVAMDVKGIIEGANFDGPMRNVFMPLMENLKTGTSIDEQRNILQQALHEANTMADQFQRADSAVPRMQQYYAQQLQKLLQQALNALPRT